MTETAEATANPFATEKAWEPGSGILPAGDYVLEVLTIEGSGNSSGGHPQIEVELGNEEGSARDWIVVIPQTVGKVVALTDAASLDRPTDEQVVTDGSGYRLDPKYLNQLVGQKVGVIVREEPDRQDPTKTRTRVKGYVTPATIKTDVPADTSGFDKTPPGVASDDDIPF